MSEVRLGDDANDMTADSIGKMKKHLSNGKLIEVRSDGEIIRLKQGPSRHANTKREGCTLSVKLTVSPSSQKMELAHSTSEIFIARTDEDHPTLSTFRKYRMITNGPSGVETSDNPSTPALWKSSKQFTSFSTGDFLMKYCMVYARHSPILTKVCIVLAAGLVGSSLGFTSEWAKEKMNESIWDLSHYAFSWLLLMILHPVVVTIFCLYLIWRLPSWAFPKMPQKTEEDSDKISATEPPIGDETGCCMAYQVQLLRDQYRLLSDERCSASTGSKIRLSDFDSASQLIDGVEVSAALPTITLCRKHQKGYKKHITFHTCFH